MFSDGVFDTWRDESFMDENVFQKSHYSGAGTTLVCGANTIMFEIQPLYSCWCQTQPYSPKEYNWNLRAKPSPVDVRKETNSKRRLDVLRIYAYGVSSLQMSDALFYHHIVGNRSAPGQRAACRSVCVRLDLNLNLNCRCSFF